MGAQVIDVTTQVSELGTALVTTMAKRKHSLSDVTKQTNMAYETLMGLQMVRTQIRRPTIDKVAEYLGWTTERVLKAAQRPSKSALVTEGGVKYPIERTQELTTNSCETCHDLEQCQTVVNAGGLALCEGVIDVDKPELPPARRFPISALIGAPEKHIDHRAEALDEKPAPIEEKPAKPVLPSLGLSLTVLEMMIVKAQSQDEEKGLRDWVAAAQVWMPTVRQAAETSQ